MTVQVKRSKTEWWRVYAARVHRPPEEVAEIMRVAGSTPNTYPHVRLRSASGKSEAFLPGTGLAVWEISWLARVYRGDVQAVADHLSIDSERVEEGLRYAQAHAAEIDPVVRMVEEASEERLRTILPGMRIFELDPESNGDRTQ